MRKNRHYDSLGNQIAEIEVRQTVLPEEEPEPAKTYAREELFEEKWCWRCGVMKTCAKCREKEALRAKVLAGEMKEMSPEEKAIRLAQEANRPEPTVWSSNIGAGMILVSTLVFLLIVWGIIWLLT